MTCAYRVCAWYQRIWASCSDVYNMEVIEGMGWGMAHAAMPKWEVWDKLAYLHRCTTSHVLWPPNNKQRRRFLRQVWFDGATDKVKDVTCIRQFDVAYRGGNLTKESKIRKLTSVLKENALQWWTSISNDGSQPTSREEFKRVFCTAWLIATFKVDMVKRGNLNSQDCESSDAFTKKFWKALLPVNAFWAAPQWEQVETYCSGSIRVVGLVYQE